MAFDRSSSREVIFSVTIGLRPLLFIYSSAIGESLSSGSLNSFRPSGTLPSVPASFVSTVCAGRTLRGTLRKAASSSKACM